MHGHTERAQTRAHTRSEGTAALQRPRGSQRFVEIWRLIVKIKREREGERESGGGRGKKKNREKRRREGWGEGRGSASRERFPYWDSLAYILSPCMGIYVTAASLGTPEMAAAEGSEQPRCSYKGGGGEGEPGVRTGCAAPPAPSRPPGHGNPDRTPSTAPSPPGTFLLTLRIALRILQRL